MLSIGKLVAGAERYYLRTVAEGREEYYTGSGEAPGTWLGKGAARLGLQGEVDGADLSLVLGAMGPDGRMLGVQRFDPARRVAGFDLTWSAPKSVSLLYGLGDDAVSRVVRDVHQRAVADALCYLESHGLRVRRGAGGTRRLEAEGLVAAAFLHRTSRAGDPQLHTHVLVANVARGEDGQWSALDARRLYFHARTAGFLYQAALRAGLTDALGVRFGPVVNGTAELADVSPALLRAFSTRRAEIEAHLEAAGARSARAAEIAALATRSPKAPELVLGRAKGTPALPGGLRARWRARAEALSAQAGIEPLMGRHQRSPLDDEVIVPILETLSGPEGLTAEDSTFERRDVVRAVAAALPDGASVAEVQAIADRFLGQSEVVALERAGRGGETLHTTSELLHLERGLLAESVSRVGAGVGTVPQAALVRALAGAPHLAAEQRAVVTRLTTSGAGVEVVVGKAGAGKTAALAAARAAWESAGHRVLGAALAARAAKGLEEGAGIRSVTLARLRRAIETGEVRLGRTDVLVVDEAGMVGTRAMAAVLGAAARAQAKVVLVGDPRQLPEIAAGGAFGALAATLGAAGLEENRRQRSLWERGALDELRHGDVRAGLSAYVDHCRLQVAPDLARARHQLVEAWRRSWETGEDAVMLAVNRSDVAALNAEARRQLRLAGRLGPDLVGPEGLGLAHGDVVVCLRNDARLGVVNGTRGSVEAADPESVTLSTSDGPRVLSADYVAAGHLAHGYATTVHKSQGATVDRAFVLATTALTREAGYVAMSRAREGTELFVPASAVEDGVTCETGLGDRADQPVARVAERLSVSRAKDLALASTAGHEDGAGGGPAAPPPLDRGVSPPPVTPPPVPSPVFGERAAPLHEPAGRHYLERAMGTRPHFADERAEYDRVATILLRYRRRFGVEGDDSLGPRPLEAFQRLAYDEALAELRRYERRLGRSRQLEPPDLGLGR